LGCLRDAWVFKLRMLANRFFVERRDAGRPNTNIYAV
jgi:hypothetical protein